MGYEDPRLSVYFLPMEGNASYGVEAFDGKTYQAVPAGHANAQNDTVPCGDNANEGR